MIRTVVSAVSIAVAALALSLSAQRPPLPPITATPTAPVVVSHSTDVHQPQTWPTATVVSHSTDVHQPQTWPTATPRVFTVPAAGTYVIRCESRYNEFVGYWWDMCLPATMTPGPAYP